MSNFRSWYVRNQDAITWFIIGWLAMGLLDNLTRGSFIWAGIDAVLIWANYKLNDFKMQ